MNQAAAPPAARLPLGASLNCGQTGHFARDCPTRDHARKPVVSTEHEAVMVTAKNVTEGLVENYSGIRQCTYCGAFDHVDSQCAEISANHGDEIAYNRRGREIRSMRGGRRFSSWHIFGPTRSQMLNAATSTTRNPLARHE